MPKTDIFSTHEFFPVFIDPDTGEFYEQLSPRKFMQLLGTEYFRFCTDKFFVLLMQNSCEDVIIPDVRFENEAAICDLLIGIHRDIPSVNAHSSEEFAETLLEGEHDGLVGTIPAGNKFVEYLIVYNTQGIEDLERKLRKHVEWGNI